MLVIPRATEKAYTEETKHTYVFIVPAEASKQLIAKEVAEQFKVTVKDVRVLTRKGKKTRYSRGKHAYPGTTYRRDRKLAYVTVGEKDKIPVFNEQKAEQKQPEKTAEKKAKKEAKKGGDK
ncbi:50S ribosomal protein L23 [Candidatus Saccharibacteria bacterium]|nr:50S ribosomal protein L23 [Candidatus Saccharibacteria bacterium]